MTPCRAVALAFAVIVACPLAEAAVPARPAGGLQETIGPAAAGGARRYTAAAAVSCVAGICVADFGRKKGKVRTIQTLSCVLITDESGLYAAVTLSEAKDVVDFYIPPAANTWTEAGTYTVFERTTPFVVPSDVPFSVELWTSGDQASAVCSATGTIE